MHVPRGLSPTARAAYRRAAAAVERSGRDPEPVADSLMRYALVCERLRELRVGWERDGKPMPTRGSRDQVASHPTLADLIALERHADESLKRLGIALAPPQRAGHQPGQAQALDRRAPSTNVTALEADFDQWVRDSGNG